MITIRTICLLFLTSISFFLWGFYSLKYELVPATFLNEITEEIVSFSEGHELENETTIVEKVKNDFFNVPLRDLMKSDYPGDLGSAVNDKSNSFDTSFSKVLVKADGNYSGSSNFGGIIISSKFMPPGAESIRNYALVIDASGRLIKVLDPSVDKSCKCGDGDQYSIPLLEDKDLNERGLTMLNACNERLCVKKPEYNFHHFQSNSYADDAGWIWDGLDLVEYNLKSGSELNRVSMGDIINANPELHIFESRLQMNRKHWWKYGDAEFGIVNGKSYVHVANADHDPFHPNDVEPLSESHALAYEMFEAGDLLVSLRSINLLFVVRPSTKKVLWHLSGLTSRQHDPDWNKRGTITVFDNRFHNGSSHISEIDPATDSIKPIVRSTSELPFFKPTGGNHALSEDGSLVFFNTDAHIFGVDHSGNEVKFVVSNQYKNGDFLEISIVDVLTEDEMNVISNSICKEG